MSTNARWALALVGVVVLIGAAVVLGTGDDSNTATETNGSTGAAGQSSTGATGKADGDDSGDGSTSKSGDGGDDSGTGGAKPDSGGSGGGDSGGDTGGASPDDNTGGASPQSEGGAGSSKTTNLDAEGGYLDSPILVAGRSQPLTAKKGQMVYLRAFSRTGDEIHVHGYDITVPVPANKMTKFKFRADIDGVFEIEFHSKGTEVAKLKVSP